MSTLCSSIWPIDMTLSGVTTTGWSGPGSDGNKGVLRIPQSSNTTQISPSDCLVSNPGDSLVESWPSVEKQSVYSVAPADWATGLSLKVGLTSLQISSRCILQPQPNGPQDSRWRWERAYLSAEKQSVYSKQPYPTGPQDSRGGGLTSLQRSSRCILQPQPNGPQDSRWRWERAYLSAEKQSAYSIQP